MLTIRMSKTGRKHALLFTIVATDSRSQRDGNYIEKLGQYDPKDDKTPLKNVDVAGIKAWMEKGATISDTVRTLLKRNKISL